jgi:hypothetical protein
MPDTGQSNSLAQSTPARRSRGSVACRRCRRLRVKCVHGTANPPCEACKTAGPIYANQCKFPKRGEADVDRDWRSQACTRSTSNIASPTRAEGHAQRDPVRSASQQSSELREGDGSLGHPNNNSMEAPTGDQIIDSCRVFMTSYFQLGFIPKATFSERIMNHEVDQFLILCILCLSARFTPCLIAKYGNGTAATDFFMLQALQLVPQKMYSPNLENTQGFFLLSIAEWGNGERERSSIHMGIAVRMAAVLRLHREETYHLREDATEEEIIDVEMGRRTFWMIQSQDNLHSGYNSPAPFSLDDISALLPCEESDFLFGVTPHERAALQGTIPAIINPSLTDSPKRSLFATLIQTHSLWGKVARKAAGPSSISSTRILSPLSSNSEYMRTVHALGEFENHLPQQQKWSVRNLNVWKDFGFELAYLSVVMMLRLSNIIVRRMYLEDIKSCVTDNSVDDSTRNFWEGVSGELFHNVEELYTQIKSSFSIRSRTPAQAYPAILVLPVYVCGSLALNLWKCPALCPDLAGNAAEMLTRCLDVITELQLAWPMAKQWHQGLQQAATPSSGQPSPVSNTTHGIAAQVQSWEMQIQSPITLPGEKPVQLTTNTDHVNQQSGVHTQIDPNLEISTLPNDLFDAEVTAFLQGEAHFGFWDM